MPQTTVGVSAVPIPNNGTDSLYGINVGATTLYYSQSPDVSTASGTPLSPGNAITWPQGQPLYILSVGGNGTFAYESNGSSISIGAVAASLLPGQSVGINGTVGVAGNVGVSGNVGSANTPAQLATSATAFGSGASGSPVALAAIPNIAGIGSYASLIVNVSDNSLLALSATSMINITGYQMSNGVQVGPSFNAQYLLGQCHSFLQIPVIGDTLVISGSYVSAGGASGTITVQVVGSNEVVAAPSYLSYNLGASGSIANNGYFQEDVTVVTARFVQSKNGPAVLSVLAGTSTSAGSANVQICEFTGPAQPVLMGTGAIPTGGSVNVQCILPMRPIIINARPTASDLIVSLQQ